MKWEELGCRPGPTTNISDGDWRGGGSARIYDFGDTETRDTEIEVETNILVKGGVWSNIVFRISPQNVICFNASTLHTCSFTSLATKSGGRVILSSSCKAEKLEFSIDGGHLSIRRSSVDGLQVGSKMLSTLIIESSHVKNPIIKTRVNDVTLRDVQLEGGIWEPDVRAYSGIHAVRFDQTQVGLAAFTNAGPDLSSVSLEHARIVDKWAELRDNYTGPRLFIAMLLTAGFLAPYCFKAAYYLAVSKVLPSEGPSRDLWEVLVFGTRSGLERMFYGALAIVLLAYTGGRLLLTLQMAMLREREEHLRAMGFSKYRPPDVALRVYWAAHGLLRWAFYVALISGIWRVYEVLTLDVISL